MGRRRPPHGPRMRLTDFCPDGTACLWGRRGGGWEMRMRTVGLGTHSGGSWLAMSRVEDAWNDLSDFTSNLERRRSPCFAQNRKRNGTPPAPFVAYGCCAHTNCKPQPQEEQRTGWQSGSTCGIYHHQPTRPNRDWASRCTK